MVGENTTLWGGLVAVLTLFALDYLLKFAADRSRRLRKVVEGEPRLLVRDGRVLTKALSEERVDVEDVRAAARGAGIARLEDVRLAVLETDGSISIIPRRARPANEREALGDVGPPGRRPASRASRRGRWP